MSYVARRKLNFQQLENALGMPLPTVIKGYATLREAKLAEKKLRQGGDVDRCVTWYIFFAISATCLVCCERRVRLS